MDKIKEIMNKCIAFLKKTKDAVVKYVKSTFAKIKPMTKSFMDNLKKIDIKKVKTYGKKAFDYVVKYKRYFAAGALFVAFSLLIVFGAGKKSFFAGNHSASGDAAKFEKNKYEKVNELINNYYSAYAEGDREQLAQCVEPLSKNEADYIALFSKYVEKYTVKNVYTQQGLEKGSYLVSVEMAVKFVDVETEAPGVEFFYVETGREGKLYINNLYSQFNMQVNEYTRNDKILAAIYAYEDRTELQEIQLRVEEEYRQAVSSDELLEEMVTTTIARAVSEWMASIEIVLNQEPPQGILSGELEDEEDLVVEDNTGDEPNQEQEDAEQDEEPVKPDEPKQEILDVLVVEKVITSYRTNVRVGPATTTDILAVVEGGTALEVVAIDVWGAWTCVKVGEQAGFIRNDLISTVVTEYSVAGKPAYPTVGQEVVMMQDQNAHVKMDASSEVIANLKLGTTVKVEMSYANGWSKVSWDNGVMVGYVLTASLKLD